MQRQPHTMCPQQVAKVQESNSMNTIKTNPVGIHSLQTNISVPQHTCD